MIFRPSRAQRGDDRFVNQKMLLFAIGAVLGIAGIAFDLAWLRYLAIAVLSVGIMLRFFGGRDG
jgi:hypothetical protein